MSSAPIRGKADMTAAKFNATKFCAGSVVLVCLSLPKILSGEGLARQGRIVA